MAEVLDPAKPFRRSRWPDVVIVVAIAALAAGGVLALWGDDLFGHHGPRDLPVEQAPPSATGA
jgi:hypothetical protein